MTRFVARNSLICLSLAFFSILLNSCGCEEKPYYVVKDLNPRLDKGYQWVNDSNHVVSYRDSTFPDTLHINPGYATEYSASITDQLNIPFLKTAKAYTPCEHSYGHKGLKHELRTIQVRLLSDSIINVTDRVFLGLSHYGRISVSDWLDHSKNELPYVIKIPKASAKDSLLQVQVKMTFKHRSKYSGKTDTFIWKK